jgi:hypothetical protein
MEYNGWHIYIALGLYHASKDDKVIRFNPSVQWLWQVKDAIKELEESK